jgi:hypothetical protein
MPLPYQGLATLLSWEPSCGLWGWTGTPRFLKKDAFTGLAFEEGMYYYIVTFFW